MSDFLHCIDHTFIDSWVICMRLNQVVFIFFSMEILMLLSWIKKYKSKYPKVKVKVTQSCPTLYSLWNSPGQNTGVGSLSLFQGIFPTQRSNPGLLHCRWILYRVSHEGSPRILEWVAYPFSRGSSWPRNRTRVSCIAGRFFINWATREALREYSWPKITILGSQ